MKLMRLVAGNMIIDSHHHLWKFNEEEYGWMPQESPGRANYLLPELHAVTKAAGVDGTVTVQARQMVKETEDLIAMGKESDVMKGIVGWVPLYDANVDALLEKFAAEKKVKGMRHVLQGEPDEFWRREDFHKGLDLLPKHGLRYDLLLFQHQLPIAQEFVDRHEDLEIIIDHIAKPEIHNGRVEQAWRDGMKELANRQHITGVKISGMVNEVKDASIDEATLRMYVEETIEMFGIDRVMFGTDWPVCLDRIESYKAWADMVRRFVSKLNTDEQAKILGGNAVRIYGL